MSACNVGIVAMLVGVVGKRMGGPPVENVTFNLNLRMSRDCLRSCVWSSLDSIRFGQILRCAHKRIVNIMKVYMERKNRQLELIRFRKKYRIYSRLLFRTDEVNATRMFTLGSRYNINMFDSNHFIRDTSPLFCAQSSHGKSLPDVHVR